MMYKQIGLITPRILDYDSYTVTFVFTFYRASISVYRDGWGFGRPHTQKPDIDNLVKFYLDCGNGILWYDDSKIDKVTAIKTFGNENRTEMLIMAKKDQDLSPEVKKVLKAFSVDDVRDLGHMAKELLDFVGENCEYSSDSQINMISAALHGIADRFAEPLMKIKKGVKNVT
jgi:Holliday junction resolvase RusA-like endonuclease